MSTESEPYTTSNESSEDEWAPAIYSAANELDLSNAVVVGTSFQRTETAQNQRGVPIVGGIGGKNEQDQKETKASRHRSKKYDIKEDEVTDEEDNDNTSIYEQRRYNRSKISVKSYTPNVILAEKQRKINVAMEKYQRMLDNAAPSRDTDVFNFKQTPKVLALCKKLVKVFTKGDSFPVHSKKAAMHQLTLTTVDVFNTVLNDLANDVLAKVREQHRKKPTMTDVACQTLVTGDVFSGQLFNSGDLNETEITLQGSTADIAEIGKEVSLEDILEHIGRCFSN